MTSLRQPMRAVDKRTERRYLSTENRWQSHLFVKLNFKEISKDSSGS